MRLFRYLAVAGVLFLAVMETSAFAQNAPAAGAVSVTQTGTRADAAQFWVGQANGATSCNTVAETAAQDTVTIPAPAGTQAVYLTMVSEQLWMDATGTSQVATISFTGIPTVGATPPFLSAATTLATAVGLTTAVPMVIPFNPPLKGLGGAAVTMVPSATQAAHSFLCMTAAGYYAP